MVEKELRCPNDIEEIYQGEQLFIEGCLLDDDGEALDIAEISIVAQVSSNKGVCCTFSTAVEGEYCITKEPDTGKFSFTIPPSATEKMRGTYFVAMAIEYNGDPLISSQYKAFEVKPSHLSKTITK